MLVLTPCVVLAQTQAGPEFRVNTYTPENQWFPSVASDPGGNFVVVWVDSLQYGPGGGTGIYGQRFDPSGAPLGSQFRVDTSTTFSPDVPSVTVAGTGDFVVVWTSNYGGSSNDIGIFGQRYDSSGTPLGQQFRINTYTTGNQLIPKAASDAAGNFVVVWESGDYGGSPQDGSFSGVFGQRYDSSGQPLGPEFRVNTYTTGNQFQPSVAADPAGNFVVVWPSSYPGKSGVFGQRYSSTGSPVGGEFRVNTSTNTGGPTSVASDAAGNFVVVWPGDGTRGRRFDSAGNPLADEFKINDSTWQHPSVATDAAGDFVVTWSGYYEPYADVFARAYRSSGDPIGPTFRVNSYMTSQQYWSRVAADSVGRFVVVWQGRGGQDGSAAGVFGQRYVQIVPVELQAFTIE